MTYNLKRIMTRAWEIFRKYELTFSEALRRAWATEKARPVNDKIVAEAKAEAGIEEEVNTWTGWKGLGFEVIHGSKALFGCELIYASKGPGAVYKARFFGKSQVAPVAA